MIKKKIRLAILGATGLVGREILKIIHQKSIPCNKIKLLASLRSAGTIIKCDNEEYIVEEVSEKSFEDIDICLASAGSSVSKRWAPVARKNKVIFIDNSSAYRLDPQVPLVVPEVNADQISNHDYIIGNPNCSTIQLVQVLSPLHRKFKLKKVIVSTYQAVSGAGKKGIDELNEQLKAQVNDTPAEVSHFTYQIAGNLIPHIDVFMDNGYTREEMKIVLESRKILKHQDLQITATAVRVPVVYGHSEAVNMEFATSVNPKQIRAALAQSENIQIIDDLANNLYPTPGHSIDNDNTLVGRIRQDLLGENWISLWIVSNNLRKGAALNAVQIAEYLINNNLL